MRATPLALPNHYFHLYLVLNVLLSSEMVAAVQKPAPLFKAQAVVDGVFTDISLADYLGQW